MKVLKKYLFIIFLFHILLASKGQQPFCMADFKVQKDSNTNKIVFTNLSKFHYLLNNQIVIYNWDFGDGNFSNSKDPEHIYKEADIYHVCLEVIIAYKNDSNQIICKSKVCKDDISAGKELFYNIGGQVFYNKFPITSGSANIYRIKPDKTIKLVRSMHFDTLGYYYFYKLLGGYYIIKIIPDDNELFPAYYGNSLTWVRALNVKLDKNLYKLNINLTPQKNLSGNSEITGRIYIDDRHPGKVSEVEMLLTDEGLNPLRYTFTDKNGYFKFDNIAEGNYRIFADLIGWFTPANNSIILNKNTPVVNSLMQLDWYETTDVVDVINHSNSVLNIFPNPAKEKLIVNSSEIIEKIEVYNFSGQKYFSSETNDKNHIIDISNFPESTYLVKINIKNSVSIIRKFIICR